MFAGNVDGIPAGKYSTGRRGHELETVTRGDVDILGLWLLGPLMMMRWVDCCRCRMMSGRCVFCLLEKNEKFKYFSKVYMLFCQYVN